MKIDEIISVITTSIQAISPETDNLSTSSILLGSHGVVDSVGFVTLLVTLEEKIGGELDLASVFMEEVDESQSNPFETIASLANYIQNAR